MGQRVYVDGMIIRNKENSNEWIITRNGIDHIIYFEKKEKMQECKLYVDNEEVKIPSTFMTKYLGIDVVVSIEGYPICCVYDGHDFDLAVRGRYINRKREHYPLQKECLLFPIVLFMMIGVFSALAINGPRVKLQMGVVFAIGFLFVIYLDYLNKKEKKGKYDVVNDEQKENRRVTLRICIVTFWSVALLICALILQKKDMPMIYWLPMIITFLCGEIYVIYLRRKQKKKEL